MTKKTILKYLIAIMMCTCIMAGTAVGGSLSYNNQRRIIRAGVLTFSPSEMPGFPYLFYVMDQRLDIKPAGWEFVNPLALSNMKNRMDYWEVYINNATFEDISKFDVLYMAAPVGRTIVFSVEQREKLRKFVDAGGTLWIENGGPTYNGDIDFTNFLISNIDFKDNGTRPSNGVNNAHPLLARPFQLTWQEINRLGDDGREGSTISGTGGDNFPDDRYFATIIEDKSGKAIVSGAQYGSGHIVLVGEPVSEAIALTVGESDTGIADASRLYAAQPEDLKLAYNIVNWGSEYGTFHKDPRHSGYSFAEAGSPLSILWEYKSANPAPNFTSPVILDDMVFFVDHDSAGRGTLHAFDLSPSRDRNQDGVADDGIVDQSKGAPYDEIWNGRVSSGSGLTAAYVPFNGTAIPGIAAVGLDGKVYGFDANSTSANVSPLELFRTNSLPEFSGMSSAPSLTYSDGGIFIGDYLGSLHGLSDFELLGTDWVAPKAAITSMGPVTGSPTVGYVYDDVSGTVEQLVYLPRQGLGGSTPLPGGIQVYPIRIYNDMLTSAASGTGWVPLVSRRSIGCSIKNNKWRVYIPDGTNQIDITANARLSGQPGTFEVNMDYLNSNNLLGKPILADYETDPKGASFQPRSTIAVMLNPYSAAEDQGVSCTPALGKDDILYFGTDSGMIYAVQESTSPDPRRGMGIRTEVRWKSSLLDPQMVALMGGTQINPNKMIGSPCVGDDMAYFVARSQEPGDDDSYILAYRTPSYLEINLGVPIQAGTTVEITQENPAAATAGGEPLRFIFNPANRAVSDWADVNYASGKILIRNLRPGMGSTNDLSTTQDITVSFIRSRIAGGDGVTRESQTHYAFPQTTDGIHYYRLNEDDRWNNLAWCVKLPSPATSSPTLFGSKLYVGMENGTLAAVDVDKMKGAALNLDINAGDSDTTFADNLGVMLKWNTGSGYMWEIPVSSGPAEPIYAAAAGSNGVLAVATANGLTVLYDAVTLIADGNRIVEVDAGGNVIWLCDSTTSTVETTTGDPDEIRYNTNSVPFNRPGVARRIDMGIVVADTGNNRVVLIDNGGNILLEVKDFIDPLGIMPVGMPLTLSRPQDVTAWMDWDHDTDTPVYHFLITDTGNFRIIDIAAKWDDSIGQFRNVLVWISRSTLEGKPYLYTSARAMPDPNDWDTWVVMAIVSNRQAALTGMESPGGALVKMLYDPENSTSGELMGEPYWRLPIDIDSPSDTYIMLNPRFFSRVYKDSNSYTDVLIDAQGIHVVEYSNSSQEIRHYWNQDYQLDTGGTLQDDNVTVLGGKPLFASYAQILPNGNILVTNKAISNYNAGEVFELKWEWALDRADNTYKYKYVIVWPSDADRFGANSYGLRQPSSAERRVF